MKPKKPVNVGDTHELALSLPPVTPRPELRERLMARLRAGSEFRLAVEIPHGRGEWQPMGAPGVAYQVLYHDLRSKLTTMLVKMEPGSTLPAHHHDEAEQCLVLEGEVQWQDKVFRAGDFLVAGADTVHPCIYSGTGNLLLIVSGHNEFVVQ